MEERLPEVHKTLENSLNDANEVQSVISDAQGKIPEAKEVLGNGLTTIDETTAYLNQAEDRLNEMSPKIKEDLQTAKNTADDINTLMDEDRKSTRLNSSHVAISYAVFCLKKKRNNLNQ